MIMDLKKIVMETIPKGAYLYQADVINVKMVDEEDIMNVPIIYNQSYSFEEHSRMNNDDFLISFVVCSNREIYKPNKKGELEVHYIPDRLYKYFLLVREEFIALLTLERVLPLNSNNVMYRYIIIRELTNNLSLEMSYRKWLKERRKMIKGTYMNFTEKQIKIESLFVDISGEQFEEDTIHRVSHMEIYDDEIIIIYYDKFRYKIDLEEEKCLYHKFWYQIDEDGEEYIEEDSYEELKMDFKEFKRKLKEIK